jgi:hypothetical protein
VSQVKRSVAAWLQIYLAPATSAASAAPVAAWLEPVPRRVPVLSIIRVVAVPTAVTRVVATGVAGIVLVASGAAAAAPGAAAASAAAAAESSEVPHVLPGGAARRLPPTAPPTAAAVS